MLSRLPNFGWGLKVATYQRPVNHLASRLRGREGDERLSADNSSDALRSDMDRPGKPPNNNDKNGDQAPADLGRALKTVYDDTLREDIPADFLDLLDKLG